MTIDQVLDTFYLLTSSILIFFLIIGLVLYVIGHTVKKNRAHSIILCLSAAATAAVMYILIGFNVMFPEDFNGVFGFAGLVSELSMDPKYSANYTHVTDLFFQTLFAVVATLVAISSLIGRARISAVIVFSLVFATVIYPVLGSWVWGGGGWLSEMGFIDFAGSSVVFLCAGGAGLAGLINLGPRQGVFVNGKTVKSKIKPTSDFAHLSLLGSLFILIGMFGILCASTLGVSDIIMVSNIALLTLWVAFIGILAAIGLSYLWHRKINVSYLLIGPIAGLIALCAAPNENTNLFIYAGQTIIAVFCCLYAHQYIYKLKLDDAAGGLVSTAITAGFIGTLGASILNSETSAITQLIGSVSIFFFSFVASVLAWKLINRVIGARVSEKEEQHLDATCLMGITHLPHDKQDRLMNHDIDTPSIPVAATRKKRRQRKKKKKLRT